MTKAITLLAALLCSFGSYAQTNPFVNNPAISPTPLSDFSPVASFSFTVGNTGPSAITYTSGDELTLTITLAGGTPQNTSSPLNSLGGTWLNYFTWSYNSTSKTYTGLQNQDIPATDSGTVTVSYYRTTSSTSAAPANGFSADIIPNSAAAGNSTADDHTERFTYVNDLPVTLVRFDGRANGCNADLSWETASEKDFDHFDIQYSANGSNFQTIGKMNTKGNSAGNSYFYSTAQPGNTGMYRLYLADKDGSFKISNTVTIHTLCGLSTTDWTVYPQPGNMGNDLYLQVYTPVADKIHTTITNVTGHILLSSAQEVQAGDNQLVLPVADWANGIYFIRITGKTLGTQTQKLVIR